MKITDKTLSAWIDESLSSKQLEAVSAAVQSDPDLQTRADALRSVGAALREETVEMPVTAQRMVQDVRRKIRLQEPPSPRRVPAWGWAGATACVCLLLVAILIFPAKDIGVSVVRTEIESVDSDLSGASTMVYTDYDAGWTVVWLDGVELEPGT